MPRAKRPRTLGSYLVAFGFALAVPPVFFAGVTTFRLAEGERSQMVRTAEDSSRDVLSAFDREISGHIAALRALSASSALSSGDLSDFYMQALNLASSSGAHVSLRDLSGRQVLNTRVPWGAMLATRPLDDSERSVVLTRRPTVSNLTESPITGEPVILVTMPVMRGDDAELLLSAAIGLPRISALVQEQSLDEPYGLSIADRDGAILARSGDSSRFVGKRLPGFADLHGVFGTWSGRNPHGTPIFGMYRRSADTGFVVAVGVDRAALEAPLRRSLYVLGALATILAALGIGFAVQISRTLSGTVKELMLLAEGLTDAQRDPPASPPPLALIEANVIAKALTRVKHNLNERDAALEQSYRDLERRVEERTRALAEKTALLDVTLENMDQGLMMVDAEGRVPVYNKRALALLDLSADYMRPGRTFAEIRNHQLAQGDFARSDVALRTWVETSGIEERPHVYERERPNGSVLEIRSIPLAAGGMVRTYTDITERKRAEAQIEHMVRHDPLTDLPNRLLFRERLEQALAQVRRHGGFLAVFCLDLDRFKAVNDTLGHPVGDKVLQVVAKRIRSLLRTEDTVARLGGDEFAILQVNSTANPEVASALAHRIIDAVGKPILLDAGQQVGVGASLGIALAPQDGFDPDELFKGADLALYRSKDQGRNTYRFYEPAMDEVVAARQRLELDLRAALGRREFELHYQPVLAIEANRIVSFEALLRWRHPTRGLVPPSDFIPVAEETGLIASIGEWVLRTACAEAARWPADVRVAVNVSAVQFTEAGLAQTIILTLAQTGLEPGRLELEITETALMQDAEQVLSTLRGLRSLGIRVALDDFGTGYSSLSYLRTFPFDKIKIDRSFTAAITDPNTAAIIRAVVGLGLRLGIDITAEGVETSEQFELLRQEGCAEVQGYLISPPCPATEAFALLPSRCGQVSAA